MSTLDPAVVTACQDAGLGVMVDILEIVQDRETVPADALLALTADDITTLYDSFVGPAVDGIESNLLAERLEYLRSQIEAECISTGELIELQGLAEHIEPGDTVLLEWAGVPEFDDTEEETS